MKKSTKGWINFASNDLKAAKLILDNNDEILNLALFHCQQCLEKIIKAVLENYNLRIPKVHSLEKLYAELPDEFKKSVEIDEEFINLIDDIYISSRYPIDLGLLPTGNASKKDALVLYQKTEVLMNTILEKIK